MFELVLITGISIVGALYQCNQIHMYGLTENQKSLVKGTSSMIFFAPIMMIVMAVAGSWEFTSSERVVYLCLLPGSLTVSCTILFLWLLQDKKALAYITTAVVWMLPELCLIKDSSEFLPYLLLDKGLMIFGSALTIGYAVALYVCRRK